MMGDVQMTTRRLVAERIIEYVRSKNPDEPDGEFTVETLMESSEWGMLVVAIEASIEAAQFDNCACAWERSNWCTSSPCLREDGSPTDHSKGNNPHYYQTAWCRLHMEAEIAKQGQAAGAEQSTANPNVDGAQTGQSVRKQASQ